MNFFGHLTSRSVVEVWDAGAPFIPPPPSSGSAVFLRTLGEKQRTPINAARWLVAALGAVGLAVKWSAAGSGDGQSGVVLRQLWLLEAWHAVSGIVSALWLTSILESFYTAMVMAESSDPKSHRARELVFNAISWSALACILHDNAKNGAMSGYWMGDKEWSVYFWATSIVAASSSVVGFVQLAVSAVRVLLGWRAPGEVEEKRPPRLNSFKKRLANVIPSGMKMK